MDTESAASIRDAFLFDVHRQFEGFSRWVPPPFTATIWEDGREAVMTVSEGDYERLRFVIDTDIGTGDVDFILKANVIAEEDGVVAPLLHLQWLSHTPEQGKGLDSPADLVNGAYASAMGRVSELLRDRLAAAVQKIPASTPNEPDVERSIVHPQRKSEVPSLNIVPSLNPVTSKDTKHLKRHTETAWEDLDRLQTSLGLMAEMGLLRTEAVFGDFLHAARLASLRQRQVAVFARSALLDVYLTEKAYFEAPSWKKPQGARLQGGILAEEVQRTKAGMFGRSREAQQHGADRIVAAMEGYYRECLLRTGQFQPEEVDERVKRAFGSTKAIVDKAVEGFRAALWPNWARLEKLFSKGAALD